jgi:hypothetical protein
VTADPVGLCRTCVHAHIVHTPRSEFWRCRLSEVDARFARYPRLPVLACQGWSRGEPQGAPPRDRGPAEGGPPGA